MQFLYTFYLYINTGDILRDIMNAYMAALNSRIDRMGPPPSTFGGNPFCGGNYISSPRLGSFMAASLFSSSFMTFGVMGYCNPFAFSGFCNPFLGAMNFGFGSYNMPTFQMPTFSMASLPVPKFTFTPSYTPTFTNFFSAPVKSSQAPTEEKQGVINSAANLAGKTLKKDKSKYGPAFLAKVKEISKRLNCDYRDLLGVMNSESGINAQAKNPHGSATGLIQFIESTARSLGTTTAALRNMSPIQQLDYVEKCIANSKKMAGFSASDKLSAGELYALIFLPARAKREVLTQSGENYYSANRGLDKNKDGKITKDELAQRVHSFYVSDNTFLA